MQRFDCVMQRCAAGRFAHVKQYVGRRSAGKICCKLRRRPHDWRMAFSGMAYLSARCALRHEYCIDAWSSYLKSLQEMKKLSENLRRAFSALEYTKVGNLTVLTALLEQQDRIAQTTYAGRRDTELEQDSSPAGSGDATR